MSTHFCKNCKWINEKEYNLRLELCRCYNPHNIIERNNVMRFDHVTLSSLACYYYEERNDSNQYNYEHTEAYEAYKKYGIYR